MPGSADSAFALRRFSGLKKTRVADNASVSGHCAVTHPMVHLALRTMAAVTAPDRYQKAPFRHENEGFALVLSLGICHVRHRTALLSQLDASRAVTRGGGPPVDKGASDGGKKAATGL